MPDLNTALLIMKSRLNRPASDTSLDEYFSMRIQAAQEQLDRMMPEKLDDSTADLLLLVDFAVWQYQSRDKATGEPPWLRQRLRERHLYKAGDSQ